MTKEKTAAKKTDKWGTKYLLTLNHKELTSLLCIMSTVDLPEYTAMKSAIEVGEKGNLHKHAYIVFRRSIRYSTLINRYKEYGAQVDLVTPGTEATVIDYIGNTDKEVSKGCTVLKDYTVEIGNLQASQGTRNDLTETEKALWSIKEAIDAGEGKRFLFDNFFPFMVRYGQGVGAYIEYCKEERNARNQSKYMVGKTQDEREAEILEAWTTEKTKLLLDMDIFAVQ